MNYAELRQQGICVQCRTDKAVPGKSRCPACAKKASALSIKAQHDAAGRGHCTLCKTRTPEPGRRICRDCLTRRGTRRTIGEQEARERLRQIAYRLRASGKTAPQIAAMFAAWVEEVE